MGALRIILIIMFACVFGYTAMVVVNHGWNLFAVFFGDMAAVTWAGQFNLDFTCLLALAGLWLAWRHHFSPGGLVLGVLGFLGGIMFLAPYLLYAGVKAKGNLNVLLGRTGE